jgi:hypothetical protein
MNKSSFLKLFVATITVFSFAAILPANAARATRPGNTTQPPTPISGL